MCNAGQDMTRSYIAVSEAFERQVQDPEFRTAYDALDGAFALASTLIEARSRANLTRAEVAGRMGTTQAAVARPESGIGLRPGLWSGMRGRPAIGSRLHSFLGLSK